MTYVGLWARAFVFTCAVELAVAVPLLRRAEPGRARRLAAVLLANVASHPAVWFVFPELGLAYDPMMIAAEAWAVLSETAAYLVVFPALGLRRALAIAALANAASYGLGAVTRALVGLP